MVLARVVPLVLKSVLATDLKLRSCSTTFTYSKVSGLRNQLLPVPLHGLGLDKGLYALIERAMAYCWLRYWDKKRYNQTAIPFIHVPN